ncbi:IS1380 family transposase, partial [Parafrankia sp. FMc2]|uniref:IS1380 family transposase n=1 Tax=Parafrankia sp. FMc2 TaxID=3233196 RepID=UPI0034D4F5E7
MRLLHAASRTHARFDDPDLVGCAGLVPVVRLAEQAGLSELVEEYLRPAAPTGANAPVKVGCLVAGMVAGADSIEDMELLRDGAVGELFAGVRAPSTLGSFLRGLDWGNVRQLDKVNRLFLTALTERTPLLPGAATVAFLDVDSCQRRVFGPAKQGAAFGHTKIAGKSLLVRGLNALVATLSTPHCAPVIAGTRLRGGNAGSARGAASFVAEAITTARHAGATGTLIVRADSAYYSGTFVAACRRADVRFSVTTPVDTKIHRAVTGIPEDAWTPIRYPRAVWDETNNAWISDAEIAEVDYTAFASGRHTTHGRLIVRRVRDQNTSGQKELFPTWRYHTVFTDSPFLLAQAEAQHRDHAQIEQVLADLAAGPLAHLPSGVFTANAAWLTLAATAHNLL